MFAVASLFHFASILIAGLLAGFILGNWWAVTPALGVLPPQDLIKAHQIMAQRLSLAMPYLIVAAALLPLLLMFLHRGENKGVRFFFLSCAAFFSILTAIVTLAIHVPIDLQMATWAADHPPQNWMNLIQRIEWGDMFGSASSVLAFLCQIIASLSLCRKTASPQE